MGFRLNIKYKNHKYYGTKLFGYYTDVNNYKSYKYLNSLNIGIDEYTFAGSFTDEYKLTKEQFNEFIDLYAQDYKKYSEVTRTDLMTDPMIILLKDTDGDKIISWE